MKIKPGVRFANLQPQTVLAICVAESVWIDTGQQMTITSINDGRHSHTSLHYSGNAFDIRTRGIVNSHDLADRLDAMLGVDFDVIHEGDHIHVEYQPRHSGQ